MILFVFAVLLMTLGGCCWAGITGYLISTDAVTRCDAVVCHTYGLNKKGVIPLRGYSAAHAAASLASAKRVPLLILTSFASKFIYTDAARYASLVEDRGPDVTVIQGTEGNVRDTDREAAVATSIAAERRYTHIIAVGFLPHLYRIRRVWRVHAPPTLRISFFGAMQTPFPYLAALCVWEFAMVIMEALLPVGSKRREFVLDRVGRGK